jgi:histidinol-phosphate aminotransferase
MNLIRPLVRHLHEYVPGEQPKIKGLIKLNTNENPYPPSPKVLRAIRKAVNERLRLYPSPTADRLREGLAKLHGCSPENIIVGNGSDELLAMATRAFVEPAGESRPVGRALDRSTVQFFWPSYSLYPVLTDIHGGINNPVPLAADFSLPSMATLKKEGRWNFGAALSFITTPNAPTGRAYPIEELASIARATRGVVILDEAYVDFADAHGMNVALELSNVLVARTFSKAYALCAQRIGYYVGSKELIGGLQKIRDSYNVNGLGQVAAEATLKDLGYYRRNFVRIRRSRAHLSETLSALGFEVLPSQSNFIFVRPPRLPASEWQQCLRDRRILVRWFNQDGVRDYLRITVGSEREVASLLKACRDVLKSVEI